MSIKEDLQVFYSMRKDLEKHLKPITDELQQLYSQKDSLVKKAEILSTRTSSLAKSLLEDTNASISLINTKIIIFEGNEKGIKEKITETDTQISKRIDSTDLYVKEQSEAMAENFLEYIKDNYNSIGSEITKTFIFSEVTYFEADPYGGCNAPTGKFGVYDDNENLITSSDNFYFENPIFSFDRGEYDSLICKRTDWYNEYQNNFITTFGETLTKLFSFEDFKLTIDGSKITLELV